jgi:hypothetical protein
MITPAGVECRYYYADYYRGRERQECRLIAQNPQSEPWEPKLCNHCPVPGILRANACPNLVLEGRVKKGFLGLLRQVAVGAVCTEYLVEVNEPHIGCGHCHEKHPAADLFDRSQG